MTPSVGADDHREQRGEERDQQRDPGAVDDPAEDVAAVDAARRPSRWSPLMPPNAPLGAERAGRSGPGGTRSAGAPSSFDDQRREDRHQDQEDDDDAAGHGDLVALEPGPGDPAERAALDRLAAGPSPRRDPRRSEPASRDRRLGSNDHEAPGPLPGHRPRRLSAEPGARAAGPDRGPRSAGNRSVVAYVECRGPIRQWWSPVRARDSGRVRRRRQRNAHVIPLAGQ